MSEVPTCEARYVVPNPIGITILALISVESAQIEFLEKAKTQITFFVSMIRTIVNYVTAYAGNASCHLRVKITRQKNSGYDLSTA